MLPFFFKIVVLISRVRCIEFIIIFSISLYPLIVAIGSEQSRTVEIDFAFSCPTCGKRGLDQSNVTFNLYVFLLSIFLMYVC